MKRSIIGLCSLALLMSCTSVRQQAETELQKAVDSLLQVRMQEIWSTRGQVIVTDLQTGEVIASVGKDVEQESGLVRTAAIMAALETGKVNLSDTVDVGNGFLIVGSDTMRDHNQHRGGYGRITVEQGFVLASDIATYKTVSKAFENGKAFAEALGRYGYEARDTSLVHSSLCRGIKTTPMQNLTFYNEIAKSKNRELKQVLEYSVREGLARPAASENVTVAGICATLRLSEDEYAVEFCGYFPADSPRYGIIVSMNKKGIPASGGLMAGSLFKEIADSEYFRKDMPNKGCLKIH